MTNYVIAHIDETRQNSKYRLCGDRDETIYLISECGKLPQRENRTRHVCGERRSTGKCARN